MAKIQGTVLFADFEKADTFNWTDPTNQQIKPIRSLKVLLAHGDGVVSRESLTLPPGMDIPNLRPGEVYGFPCTVMLNKKKQLISYTLRSDIAPFPAPDFA
jgi:hypothetical protein